MYFNMNFTRNTNNNFIRNTKNNFIKDTIQNNYPRVINSTNNREIFHLYNPISNKLSTKKCLEKGTEMSSKVIQQIGARL